MKLSRRKSIALIGGGVILAATASAAAFVTTRTPEKALQPWSDAGSYEDPRLFVLSYALLAPNPHNRQPWLVELTGPKSFALHRDLDRDLPHTDPFSRQLFIGLGCFLELAKVAATLRGLHAKISLYPDGADGPIARVNLVEGASRDPLADFIMDRRSCKEPFEPTPIPPQMIDILSEYGTVFSDEKQVSRIRNLTLDAWMTEMHTHRTLKESVDLMRFGKAEINANPDGIDLGGPFLESLMLAGMLTRANQLDPASTGFQEGVKIYTEMLTATPAYVVLTTPATPPSAFPDARRHQIETGRRWLRLNLETTRLGLALHPVSQALQEFEEMAPHYQEAHQLLAKPGETVQMLGRLGFGPKPARTPRWPLQTRIVNG